MERAEPNSRGTTKKRKGLHYLKLQTDDYGQELEHGSEHGGGLESKLSGNHQGGLVSHPDSRDEGGI